MDANPQNPTKKEWPVWAKGFLAALAQTGVVTTAAEAVGITRSHVYDLRRADPQFSGEWDAAMEEASDRMENEARRRAHDGLMRKKFHHGQPIIDPVTGEQYVEMEYSDTLLMFLLKGSRPEKFRERTDVRMEGKAQMEVVEEIVYAEDTTTDSPASDSGSIPQQ